MINKYGNDIKNNIFWNKEYPFIPEVINDSGFVIHEGDIVDYYCPYDKKIFAYRVYKIYNKDLLWCRGYHPHVKIYYHICSSNELKPHTSNAQPPIFEDFDNQEIYNPLQDFLSHVYSVIYDEELSLENDWHFDEEKFEAKRLEEVAKLKGKY